MKTIILLLIFLLLTTSSCWDVGYGPYGSEKGYCEYNKYNDSPSSFCLAMVLGSNSESSKKSQALIDACLAVLILEENSCDTKSTIKRYWF